MRGNELRMAIRNTKAFIDAHPITIVINPDAGRLVKTESGGYVQVPGTPRSPQVFRLVDLSSTMGSQPGVFRTSDGVDRMVTHQLVGLPDASVGVGDFWLGDDGDRYEVVEMLPDNGYERRARVVRFDG